MKKVALFFGSFNPIHYGHLILANYIAEYEEIDEVRFIVSPQNPFKKNRALMSDEWRLKMVQKAIAGYDKFSVSDVEFSLPKPSYTIDTLMHFKESEKDVEFKLVMGGDNLVDFHKWKDAEKIAEICELLVYPRPNYPTEVPERWAKSVRMLENAPTLEISSTQIRNAWKEGKNLLFFLPREVWSAMKKMESAEID